MTGRQVHHFHRCYEARRQQILRTIELYSNHLDRLVPWAQGQHARMEYTRCRCEVLELGAKSYPRTGGKCVSTSGLLHPTDPRSGLCPPRPWARRLKLRGPQPIRGRGQLVDGDELQVTSVHSLWRLSGSLSLLSSSPSLLMSLSSVVLMKLEPSL